MKILEQIGIILVGLLGIITYFCLYYIAIASIIKIFSI
jgi:hypothetical protein